MIGLQVHAKNVWDVWASALESTGATGIVPGDRGLEGYKRQEDGLPVVRTWDVCKSWKLELKCRS